VDQVCGNLFSYRPELTYPMISTWAKDEREFVRRTAFSCLCYLAIHDKKADDKKLLGYFPLIEKYSSDERNFVRKAVNWALRQIGKKNISLNRHALKLARKLASSGDKTARWIGKDAVKELENPKIKHKLVV
jgi:3-methyladenine DNA glycosylase AlkD